MSATNSDLEAFFGVDAAPLLDVLDAASVPSHVALIMDGNGRWAQKRHLPRAAGHRAGAKAVREAILTALELGIDYLTVYSFSSENWARPQEEVTALMRLFVEVLQQELENLEKKGVRLRLIGCRDRLPDDVRTAFESAEERTASNPGLTFIVALDYGGRQEITQAATAIARDVAAGTLDASSVDEETFASRLYTAGIPDPDLLIRTSGEFRVSNFLLWQIAYSELLVTDILWPDFARADLLQAVVEYQGRQRRFGG